MREGKKGGCGGKRGRFCLPQRERERERERDNESERQLEKERVRERLIE